MKSVHYVILLLLTLFLAPQSQAQEINDKTFLTVQDYPYQMLIRITDKAEVHYTEKGADIISCNVRLLYKDQEFVSGEIEVNKARFVKDAMRACLPRVQAKAVLKNVFSLL